MQTLNESQKHFLNKSAQRWKLALAQDTLLRAQNQSITLIQGATTKATQTHLEACTRAIKQSITDACVMLECAKPEASQDPYAD